MKKIAVRMTAMVFVVLMLLSLAACGDETSAAPTIVGDWKYESGNYIYHFKEDGTGIYDVAGTQMNFTYTAEDGKLTITYDGSDPMTLDYVLDGDTLNIKDSFGSDTIYLRQ